MIIYQVLWGVLAILAVVGEALTAQLVAVWFLPGAIISLILALCGAPVWAQITVFAIATVASAVLFTKIFKKHIKPRITLSGADALIGEQAVVTLSINNLAAQGQVKVRGQIWSAKSENPEIIIDENTVVTVVGIEGVKLICKL